MRTFARQFESPLILILVFAALVAAFVRDWTDTVIVLAIVLGSGVLGFAQEHRASAAVERLRNRVRTMTTVIRGGSATSLPSEEIVPGDVVLLSAGSLVPGDGVVLDSKDFFVNESALTGESVPVEKEPGVSALGASLTERANCVFMGTSVRSGTARVLIVRTGKRTIYGGIADRLRLRPPETEFERGIRRYGYFLTQLMLWLVLIVFAANVFLDRPRVDALLFAIALAVGVSPELLPAVITVTLSRGAREMAARRVIVRRLNAIENFGSMDVLCTDKTGTLTEGVMALDAALDAHGRPSTGVLREACLNARFESGLSNPLDAAIVARGERDGVDVSRYKKLDEVPYDFIRKRLSIVVADPDGHRSTLLITKGALANVLDICDEVQEAERTAALDEAQRRRIEQLVAGWSAEGYRVLGIARKDVSRRPRYGRDDEHGLVFTGFLLFLDPPKQGVGDTLAALGRLGVRLKIITGDNRLVSAHLAESVGLDRASILTGAELNELSDDALRNVATETDLFTEVDPHQKERIILALKKAGHVVGYLGDGINDAPGLHAADVGISVDGAVDVAKEAADFVLLEHDLAVLIRGVEQGRTTFANTLKYISITTSANFGNMISMAAASLFLPFLPLLAKQILLNNFLSDIPGMTIAGDNVDAEITARPRRWDVRAVKRYMLVFGLVSSTFDILTFGVLLLVFNAGAELFRTGWFVESLMTELAIALVLRTYRPFWRSKPGKWLWVSTLALMCLTIAIPYLPLIESFGFVALPPAILAVLLVITVGYVICSEWAKRALYARVGA